MGSEPKKRVSPLTLVLILIIVLLAGAAAVLALGKFGKEEAPDAENLGDGVTPLIGYEEGVTALDEDTLQKAVDEAYAKAAEGGIPLEYRNDAYGTDGINFECYIGNPKHAKYDIYIQIFADDALTDQLYLSGLIPPGKAKSSIELEHALEKGTHRVFVVYTQVKDDHATIHNQIAVTMDFTIE